MLEFSFLTVAVKNLRRKAFRTGVLVFSIGLLVTLLIFAFSFTLSVASSLRRSSDRLGADLLIVPVGARGAAEEFLLESREASFYMPASMMERVREVEGVTEVTSQTYLSTISGLCCDVAPTRIVAFNQETDFIVRPWLQRSIGRALEVGEALAGFGTAENLGLGLLDVEATLFNNKFDIVGVLEETGTGLDNALFMTEESLIKIIESGNSPLRKDLISLIFAKLEKGYDPSYTGRVIEGEIVEIDVVHRSDMGKKFLNILSDINKIFIITVLLASLLTGFLVWAIFSAIANERAREIGIMRAMGAREGHIVLLYTLEVSLLGIIGSLCGVAVGTSVSSWLGRSFTLIRSISADLTPLQQSGIGLVGLLIGYGICVAGALVPVNRIKRMEPLLVIKED